LEGRKGNLGRCLESGVLAVAFVTIVVVVVFVFVFVFFVVVRIIIVVLIVIVIVIVIAIAIVVGALQLESSVRILRFPGDKGREGIPVVNGARSLHIGQGDGVVVLPEQIVDGDAQLPIRVVLLVVVFVAFVAFVIVLVVVGQIQI